MKNMKKFAALLLTAAMTVAMVGCGSSVAANTVNSKDDLPGKKIGVQLGTTGDTDATAYEDEGSTVERYNKGSDAIQALKTGKIDCVIIDKQPAEAFVEKNDDLKILDDTFDAEEYAICIAKDNTDLTDEFNKAIEELKADGTIDTIISNYIGMKQESIHMRLRREQNIQTENLPWQPMRSLSHTNIMMVTT